MLDTNKYAVTIHEKNKALGRKFLVAGNGGFNLTHSENIADLIQRYTPKDPLTKLLRNFDNAYFREWLRKLGIETFVGTSKRVFPIKGIKPIDVLNAIERELKRKGVCIQTGQSFELNGALHEDELVIFALGGGSWKVTGSDGSWQSEFVKKGIEVKPFEASNCAFKVEWNEKIKELCAGAAIKNAEFIMNERSGSREEVLQNKNKLSPTSIKHQRVRGEAVITAFGIEGSGVYPLSGLVRKSLKENSEAIIWIDLKPDLSIEELKERYTNKGKLNTTQFLRSLHLPDTTLALIKNSTTKEEFQSTEILLDLIKQFPIRVSGLAQIDEAISTVGGIPFSELTEEFELKKMPGHFCIGEMIDWDAPTGGYLLQMCFSMGCYVADVLNKR